MFPDGSGVKRLTSSTDRDEYSDREISTAMGGLTRR